MRPGVKKKAQILNFTVILSDSTTYISRGLQLHVLAKRRVRLHDGKTTRSPRAFAVQPEKAHR